MKSRFASSMQIQVSDRSHPDGIHEYQFHILNEFADIHSLAPSYQTSSLRQPGYAVILESDPIQG